MKKNQSISKSAINGLIWMFTGSSVQVVVQLALVAILAHLLTPTDFGVMSVILIFANFSYIFTSGIAISLVQAKDPDRSHVASAYSLSFLVGLCFTLLFYFLSVPISWFFEVDNLVGALRFFAFFLPLKSINSVSEAMLRRKLKFAVTVKCSIFSYIVGFGFTSVTLALLGFGYWSMIYGQLAQLLVYTILLFLFERPVLTLSLNFTSVKQMGNFGTGFTLSNIFNFMAENGDNTVAGKLLGVTSLGIYSRAFQFVSIPSSFFGQIFDSVLLPVLSSRQDDKQKLASFYLFSLTFCFIILLPVSLLLLLNAALIVHVVLGDQWIAVIQPFQVLILAMSFRFGTRINKSYMTSMGLVYRQAYYQLIFAIMVIAFTWLGAHYLGTTGVAAGVLLASILHYAQSCIRLAREFDVHFREYLDMHLRTIAITSPLIVLFAINLLMPHVLNFFFMLILSMFTILFIYSMMVIRRNQLLFNSNNLGYIGQIVHNLPVAIRNQVVNSRLYMQFVRNGGI